PGLHLMTAFIDDDLVTGLENVVGQGREGFQSLDFSFLRTMINSGYFDGEALAAAQTMDSADTRDNGRVFIQNTVQNISMALAGIPADITQTIHALSLNGVFDGQVPKEYEQLDPHNLAAWQQNAAYARERLNVVMDFAVPFFQNLL